MEIRKEVKVYRLYLYCDDCNSGQVYSTGVSYPMYPTLYEYQCHKCSAKYKLQDVYPKTIYEDIE